MNRLRKEIDLIKERQYLLKSYYWGEKLTFSKLRFSKFKKFATKPVLRSSSHEEIIESWKFLL